MSLILVTGGVRSGKSKFAEDLLMKQKGSTLYIATGVSTDSEMQARIEKHQQRRPHEWGLVEESLDLLKTIDDIQQYDRTLVDCLSTWITNRLVKIESRDQIPILATEIEKWLEIVKQIEGEVIVVSSETGLGGVAMSSLGRIFQDALGEINQKVAEQADEVYAVLSGIPVRIKP